MFKKLLFAVMAVMQITLGYSQSNLWTKVSDEKLAGFEKSLRESMPVRYQLFSLDLPALKQVLRNAPSRENFNGESQLIVSFPNSEGVLENFRVYEAPVMAAELAEKYPDIKSYVGKGIENPASVIRFSISVFGLHTMTFTTAGTQYIDTYTKDLNNYIVYKKSDVTTNRSFECQVIGEAQTFGPRNAGNVPFSTQANDGKLRKYDLAMACTVEYAAFHINQAGIGSGTIQQKKAAVLSAMNDCMTRVNGIYEKDLSVTMQLIANNDALIFITSDNLANNNGGQLLSQIKNVINGIVSASSYDIGHVVSTGGGGIAQLGSVCSSEKARGVTGSPQPISDSFYVDYVAHEMGHQFGANHTFNADNSSAGSCYGNRNSGTAVEPGSGTTIMGYAGICAQADVQAHSDDFFHAVSLQEMTNFITTSATCSTNVNNGNSAPVITAIPNYTIPKSTAFVLRGNATDANNDALTYCWEQVDGNGAASSVSPTALTSTGPAFRSLEPVNSPNRYMPPLQNVLTGNLTPTWQVIPAVNRVMKFALTVRDNHVPNGGQTAREDVTVTVSNTAGPFKVSSLNTAGIVWNKGQAKTITWDVANTQTLAANVNVLLSTDGGATFTAILSGTPNDGNESIVMPASVAESSNCRLIIEGAGNIFYAVNTTPFAVGALGVEDFGLDSFVIYPSPNKGNFTVEFSSESSNDVNISVHDMRGRQIFEKAYNNTGVFSGAINLDGAQAGVYLVTVEDAGRKEVKRIVVE
mgnify:CR=1 FL=1